jgi:hypothetical protein
MPTGLQKLSQTIAARAPAFRNIDLATWVPAQIGSQECGSFRHRYSYIHLNSTGFTSALSMTSMPSSTPWASKPHDNRQNENKIPTTATITV